MDPKFFIGGEWCGGPDPKAICDLRFIKKNILQTSRRKYNCDITEFATVLWEERKLKVFENKVLRIKFGPRRDEVTGE